MEENTFLLSTIWLFVTDIGRSRAFYENVLGFKTTAFWPEGAMYQTGDVTLGIHQIPNGKEYPSGGSVTVFGTKDIDSMVPYLKGKGVVFDKGITRQSYGITADFRDPDGHKLQLLQTL